MKLFYIIVSLLCLVVTFTSYGQKKDPYVTEFFAKGGFLNGPIYSSFVQGIKKDYISKRAIEDFIEINQKKGFKDGKGVFLDDLGSLCNEMIVYYVKNGRMSIYNGVNIADGKVILKYNKKYFYLKDEESRYKNVLTLSVGNYKGEFHGDFRVLNQDSLPLYQTKFNHGKGYWKDYYYLAEKDSYKLKEEGKVKNNYKAGKWKYYTEDGNIEREVIYTQKDSVDVRFPHCLFNKKEPCMKKEELIEQMEYRNRKW